MQLKTGRLETQETDEPPNANALGIHDAPFGQWLDSQRAERPTNVVLRPYYAGRRRN